MAELAERQCVPCSGGVPPMKGDEVEKLSAQLPEWQGVNEHHLQRTYRFKGFAETLRFVNRVGELAEQQGHHPDVCFCLGEAEDKIWTHQIDGPAEREFLLAEKIGKPSSGPDAR